MATDFFSSFAKEGGRVGSGALGSGQGGVGDVRDDVRAPLARPEPPAPVPPQTCRPPGRTPLTR